MKEFSITAIDAEGHHLTHPRPFDTKKEAVKAARELSKDRMHWQRIAESETFPDEITAIAILADGEEVDQIPAKL